jgi:hypothetical protein
MEENELTKFIYTNIKDIFTKLSPKETADIITVALLAYQSGYDQALLDVEKLSADVLNSQIARNN